MSGMRGDWPVRGILSEAAQWCGCGDHDRMDRLMLAYLTSLDVPEGETPDWPDADTVPDGHFLLAYIAGSLDWTEHGTTIRYPWLTDAGRAALARFRA